LARSDALLVRHCALQCTAAYPIVGFIYSRNGTNSRGLSGFHAVESSRAFTLVESLRAFTLWVVSLRAFTLWSPYGQGYRRAVQSHSSTGAGLDAFHSATCNAWYSALTASAAL
jgi:hypothetical protein